MEGSYPFGASSIFLTSIGVSVGLLSRAFSYSLRVISCRFFRSSASRRSKLKYGTWFILNEPSSRSWTASTVDWFAGHCGTLSPNRLSKFLTSDMFVWCQSFFFRGYFFVNPGHTSNGLGILRRRTRLPTILVWSAALAKATLNLAWLKLKTATAGQGKKHIFSYMENCH